MKRLLHHFKLTSQQGQSLVEMAITAPILIFLLIGVFEVGWALRGYLVLTNVNREITRFAIRPGYLNYAVKANSLPTSTTTVGYDKVLSYTYTTLADQLPLDFSTGKTSTLIISHFVADTGVPCKDTNNDGKPDCNCNDFTNPAKPDFYLNGTNVLTFDDILISPARPGFENFYYQKFPPTSTAVTRLLPYTDVLAKLARENNKFNCELLKKSSGVLPSANNVIITEIYYNQPQLFGFPLISNPFTNPVPMYAQTAMRMIVASRSGENIDNIGPLCMAMPFTLKNTRVATATSGMILDILGGEPPAQNSEQGYLAWNPQWNSQDDLENEIYNQPYSFNAYRNAQTGSTDTTLSVGDWVAGAPGNMAGLVPDVQTLVGKEIIIPVFDNYCKGNNGGCNTTSVGAFHISSFVKVKIIDSTPYNIDLDSGHDGDPNIYATYVGPATECQ